MGFNIYALLTPIALSLLAFELIYCLVRRNGYFTFQETIANMGTAIGNQVVNVFVAWLVIVGYGFLYENYSLFKIERTWYSFIGLFLAIDFLFYWFHRAGHRINFLWAAHMPHHSAEEMNLAVGLRASVTQRLFSFTFFWPLTLLGYDPMFIYMGTGLHLIMGYWHHTKVIGKLGWFEKWFNTPSHHRVHHGTNAQYLDKNYAEFLILWDKLFGTFEEENEEVCYGVLGGVNSWNPVAINFQHWRLLFRQAREAPFFWDKIKVWFMPPGWAPRGLEERYPRKTGMTLAEQTRFRTRMFHGAPAYLITQLVLGIGLMVFIIHGKSPLNAMEKVGFSALLWTMIIVWGGLLESRSWAGWLELLRLTLTPAAFFLAFQKYAITVPGLFPAIVGAATLSAVWTAYFFVWRTVPRQTERPEQSAAAA